NFTSCSRNPGMLSCSSRSNPARHGQSLAVPSNMRSVFECEVQHVIGNAYRRPRVFKNHIDRDHGSALDVELDDHPKLALRAGLEVVVVEFPANAYLAVARVPVPSVEPPFEGHDSYCGCDDHVRRRRVLLEGELRRLVDARDGGVLNRWHTELHERGVAVVA